MIQTSIRRINANLITDVINVSRSSSPCGYAGSFPIAYEVLAGNTADRTTLRGFLQKIEAQYGKADRIWVMDRVHTEEVLYRNA